MCHRPRFLAAFVVLCIGVAGVVAASSGVASADPSTLSTPTELIGTTHLGTLGLTTSSDAGVGATASVDTALDWNQPVTVSTAYDPDDVTQGGSVAVSDSYTRTVPGHLTANWSVNDLAVSWAGFGPDPIPIGTVGLNATGSCNLRAGGPDYVCHLESGNQTEAGSSTDLGSPYVKAKISADVTVTPQGIAALRTTTVGGSPAGTANLVLGESPIADTFGIACAATVGNAVGYSLGTLSTTPGISVQTTLAIEIGSVAVDPSDPNGIIDVPTTIGTFPADATTSSVPMTGAGVTFALGGVQDNGAGGGGSLVAAPGGPYSGTEGSPISFDGSASTGGCGALESLQWKFSDDGTASGATPQHTFADNGTYTGWLTATDTTGATSTTTFSITVVNVAPSVNAGTDASTDWGRSVTFTGQATDPSSVDQPSLQYSWDFGDGTPPATGSATTTHAYATPGALGYYDATLTVCDKDTGCNSDVRRVTVTKRDTTTTYTGDTSGTFDSPGTVRASLVDEYGQKVVGRTVNFQVGTDGPFVAATNANGVATTSYTPTLPAGSFSGSSSFAGDSLYKASSDGFTFGETRNASHLSYTGDTNGRPNTTVNVSAVLTDENGKPIAGRTVVFLVDTQLTTATTDAHGVASTSVRFSKRSGLSIVLAGWVPTGADGRRYWGSADGALLRVQPT